MCFGMDWCRAKSAAWLKLPESSIQFRRLVSRGHVLAVQQICNKSNSFPGDFHEWLVEACWSTVKKLPTYGWHEAQIPGVSKLAVVGGHGNPVLGNLWKLKELADADLGDGSLPESWIFMNFLQIESWKVTSAKIKHIHRKTRKQGRLWRVFFFLIADLQKTY